MMTNTDKDADKADAGPKPGSREWLEARIAEHKTAQEQASAQANAHGGSWQAYDRLLKELPASDA